MSGIQARLGSFRVTLPEKNVAGLWKLPSFILVLPLWSPMVSLMTEVLGPATSLTTQWFKVLLPLQGAGVPSLVGELRAHMPCSVAKKERKRSTRTCSRFSSSRWSVKEVLEHPQLAGLTS